MNAFIIILSDSIFSEKFCLVEFSVKSVDKSVKNNSLFELRRLNDR